MQRAQRLQPVLSLASESESREARGMLSMRMQLHKENVQLQDLLSYRHNYEANAKRAGNGGIDAASLAEYHRFLSRLGEAVEQQQRKREHFEHLLNDQVVRWKEAHAKTQSISHLIQHYVNEERRAEVRREQKMLDDAVSTRYRAPELH